MTTAARQDLINALGELADGEQRWSVVGLRSRARILGEVQAAVAEQSDAWVAAACRAKGLDPTSPLVGEEWLSGPYAILTALDRLRRTLAALAFGNSLTADLTLGTAPGNRTTVPILPATGFDRLLLHGFRTDIWLQPGISPDTARAEAGLAALEPGRTAGIGLGLGAGNVSCIGPLDVLTELIAHNRVTLLKLNPTLDALLEPIMLAFAPLIDLGILRIVTGGPDVGQYLVDHPDVAHVHITGSATTRDQIVWGTGGTGAPAQARRETVADRTVVRGPFRPAPRALLRGEFSLSPRPPWFVFARTGRQTSARLTRFAARPSWRALLGIIVSAVRG